MVREFVPCEHLCLSTPILFQAHGEVKARTQKRFALSSLFSKATDVIVRVFKSVSLVNNVEILSICLWNNKKNLKDPCEFKQSLLK